MRSFHGRGGQGCGKLVAPPLHARGDWGDSEADGGRSPEQQPDGDSPTLCRAKLSALRPSPAAASATSLALRSACAASARSLAALTRALNPLPPPPHALPASAASAVPARSGLTAPGTGLKRRLGLKGSQAARGCPRLPKGLPKRLEGLEGLPDAAGSVPWVLLPSGVRRERRTTPAVTVHPSPRLGPPLASALPSPLPEASTLLESLHPNPAHSPTLALVAAHRPKQGLTQRAASARSARAPSQRATPPIRGRKGM